MTIYEALRHIMLAQSLGVSKLADRLGIKQNSLSNRLSGDRGITIEKIVEMTRAMDYKVVLMPRDSRLPKDSYEVE